MIQLMKKFGLIILLFCCLPRGFAQKNIADSLSILLEKEINDSNRVTLLWKMANASSIYNPDTAMILANKALALARQARYEAGESMALGIIANTFLKIGNYPRALDFYLKKLKIEENRNDPNNLATVIMNIGVLYVLQEEYRKAIINYMKADSICSINNIEKLKYNIALNLGDVYNRLNIHDSAYAYFSKSLHLAEARNDGDLIGASKVGLGHVYFKLGNDTLTRSNYTEALVYLHEANDEELICEASLGLAKLYEKLNRPDSSETYARNTLFLAKKDGFLSFNLDAASFLSDHYKKRKIYDSALYYHEQAESLKDSISSKDRVRESQILSSNEQLRQAEIAETKRRAAEERNIQLQYLFIGMFIPGFFLITLLLSRIRVHIRLIKLLGILSLLILFEYLTLLLHPYVVELTHHKPVYEIMIFVSIAAILIPAHHRIEHWLIKKLTHTRSGSFESRFSRKTIKIKKPSN